MTERDAVLRQVFRRGDASADELLEAAQQIVTELGRPDSEAAEAARAAGLDPAVVSGASVVVVEQEQGAEPIATTILVAIAVRAGSAVVESLWRDVIWPRIRRKLGATALGDPEASSAAAADDAEHAGR